MYKAFQDQKVDKHPTVESKVASFIGRKDQDQGEQAGDDDGEEVDKTFRIREEPMNQTGEVGQWAAVYAKIKNA